MTKEEIKRTKVPKEQIARVKAKLKDAWFNVSYVNTLFNELSNNENFRALLSENCFLNWFLKPKRIVDLPFGNLLLIMYLWIRRKENGSMSLRLDFWVINDCIHLIELTKILDSERFQTVCDSSSGSLASEFYNFPTILQT